MSWHDDIPKVIKAGMDLGFVGAFIGWVLGFLPGVLLVLGVVWYTIQIWESATGVKVRLWVGHRLVRSFQRFEAHEPAHVTELVPVVQVTVQPAPVQSQSATEQEPAKPA